MLWPELHTMYIAILYLDSEYEVHWDLYVWINQIQLICQLLNLET
jgi:hypothetical protein